MKANDALNRSDEAFARNRMLQDENAALRAKLAQAHEHLEAQRQATYQAVEREHLLRAKLSQVEQQLAAAQAERDEAVRVAKALTEPSPITEADVTWAQDSLTQLDLMRQQLATAQNELCTAQDQIPPDMDGDSLSVALIKLKDQRRELQAEIARLKHELSQLLFFTPGGGQ